MRRPVIAPPFLGVIFAILCGIGELAGSSSATPHFERMLEASNHPLPPPYRALRRLEANLSDSARRGWLEAWTEFQPGRGLRYNIVNEGGSEYVRNNILKEMLATEQELLAAGRRLRASLESKNYEFTDGGMTADGLQRVLMTPARKSDGLVNGALFVHPSSQMLTRIEGRLVKSPSFWMRDVDVTWNFARIAGYLVPTEMSSSGRVRMFGPSNFRMVYEYQTIDGMKVAGIP